MGTLRGVPGRANWLGIITILAIFGIWQLVVGTHLIDYSAIPSPTEIWSGFKYLGKSGGGLWSAIGHTVKCVLISWVLAVLIGGAAGLVLALNRTVAGWTTATVDMARSLPVVALIPVAILIWGTGDKTEIVLGTYAAVWPMLINTAGGVRGVSPRLRDVARTMQLSRWETMQKVVMPSTAGAMLVGARLALAVALVVCVVAEMLGLQSGVGNQLILMNGADQPARAWAYVLVAGFLGLCANLGLMQAMRLFFPGIAAISERRAR